jgi:hypothetical protein
MVVTITIMVCHKGIKKIASFLHLSIILVFFSRTIAICSNSYATLIIFAAHFGTLSSNNVHSTENLCRKSVGTINKWCLFLKSILIGSFQQNCKNIIFLMQVPLVFQSAFRSSTLTTKSWRYYFCALQTPFHQPYAHEIFIDFSSKFIRLIHFLSLYLTLISLFRRGH